MPSPDRDSADEPRRWFVGIGVGDYDDATLNLDHALNDVRRMSTWFTAESGVAHEVALADLAENPTFDQISRGLAKFLQSCATDEVVVLYIACHGEEENTVSYLFGRDSPREMLAGRALVAEQLGQMLGSSRPHNVLIIIDACVAGAIAAAVGDATRKAARAQNSRDPGRQFTQVIISSTFGLRPAQDGKFVDAFLRAVAHERWTGTVQPWIGLERFLEGINAELAASAPGQYVECGHWSNGGEIRLIPNPNVGRRPSSALFDDAAFAAHFDPASRGVSRGESGSYFTGRTDELARVNEWLRQAKAGADNAAKDKQHGMFVITGSPGSGKSALLSRIAVLSASRELRQQALRTEQIPAGTVPEPGVLDAVIWCHGKTQHQLIGEIARAMGGNAATPNALMTLAGARREPLVVAVDALDEAVSGESEKMAREVLAPLSRDTALRFLVATRRYPVGDARVDLLKALAVPETAQLYLDAAENLHKDMTTYVMRRLAARNFPVGKNDEGNKTRKLARDIAGSARESFLVASIAARTVAPGEPEKFKLPSDVGQALAGYLDRLPNPESARNVLRPLAWAQGPGLPWGTIWPMLATRLAPGQVPVKDAAIAATLDAAGDLIVESVNAGEPVYRLFHEALAEHLRDTTPAGIWAPTSIAWCLLDIRDGRAWAEVPRYVRTFLPAFLMRAEMTNELRDLLLDPTWVRQRRLDTGDSLAALHDVEAACELFRRQRSSFGLAQLCYQYSRLMTSALPPLIELLARSGQSIRAEAMAGNLEDIADRMLTYRALSIVHGENGDAAGAARYVDEVMRCLPAMHADHQPMAWCWAAEAWMAAGLAEQAKSAAEEALKAVTLSDDWDRLNGLFWAAKAARASKSEAVRKQVAGEIDALAQKPAMFRNQALQAAAVAGCTGFLKAKLAEIAALPPGTHSPVRIGNLALALADAGLGDEMAQLVAHVQTPPWGEQDSLKRWAWALALSGRHTAAIEALELVREPFERSKALARIADIIASTDDKRQIERLAKLIAAEPAESGSRTEARLILASWRLGQRQEALLKVEKAIAANAQPGVMVDPRADSRGQPMGAHDQSGKKTARRAMTTSRAPTSDEASCRDAQAAADKGDLAVARQIASRIEIPRYRVQALGRIVQKEPNAMAAEDVWMEALIAAIRGGRALAEEIMQIMFDRWKTEERWEDCVVLTSQLHDVDFTWQREFFSDEYAALRVAFEPDETRTHILDRLMMGPIALGANLIVNDDEVERKAKIRKTWERGTDGDRLFSLGVMIGNYSLTMADLLVDAIRNSRSAFEQYYGLRAASDALMPPGLAVESWLPLKADGKAALARAINDELAGVPRADGSRSSLDSSSVRRKLAERILAKIGEKN